MDGHKRCLPSENLKPYDVHYIENPSQEELRKIALKHTPAIYKTAYSSPSGEQGGTEG